MSPTLDRGLLAEVRPRADARGMYHEAGLGNVNRYASPETPEPRAIGEGDIVRGLTRVMEASADMGCLDLWVGTANDTREYCGRLAYDLFPTDADWADQLAATTAFLQKLAPIARSLGIHLNLEMQVDEPVGAAS